MTPRITIAIITAIIVSGCIHENTPESDNADSDLLGKPARDLTLADFNAPDYDILDKSEFYAELHDIGEFKNEDDDDAGYVDDACLGDQIADPVIQKGFNGNGQIEFKLDRISECVSLTSAFEINEFVISFILDDIVVNDASGNRVNIIGLRMSELAAYKTEKLSSRANLVIRGSFHDDGKVIPIQMRAKIKTHHESGIAAGCSGSEYRSGCVYTSIIDFKVADSSNDISFTELKSVDLYHTEDAPYFYNGTMEFQINNWVGYMQYGSTGFTTPTYYAENELGKSVEGTYGSPVYYYSLKPDAIAIPVKQGKKDFHTLIKQLVVHGTSEIKGLK